MKNRQQGDAACAACVATRRDFLRGTGATLAGLLLSGSVRPHDAAALPVQWTHGIAAGERAVSFPIPAQDGALVDRDNQIILVRWRSALFAFALSCPHQRTMLKWLERDQRFQCPKHKSKYHPDGTFISGRATRGMDRHPLRVAGGRVVVDTARLIRQDQNAAAWNAAVARIG